MENIVELEYSELIDVSGGTISFGEGILVYSVFWGAFELGRDFVRWGLGEN